MTTRFIGHLLTGTHAARPAASAVPEGTLYSCTTHVGTIYQSDLVTWNTWSTMTGGSVSVGSNSTRIREVSTIGASTTQFSPFDHAHDGIGTITASSSNTMQRGTFNLRSGNNISFGLTDSDGDGEFDTLTVHGAAAGGGSGSLTVADEGVDLATAATKLDFVGAGVTASGTGATKTITISSGSFSTSYLGYNTVGGTEETATINRVIAKSVTPGADGVLSSIEVYTRETADSLQALTVGVYENNAGSLGKLIAANRVHNLAYTNNATFGDGSTTSIARWLAAPIGVKLTGSTTYWIAIQYVNAAGGSPSPRLFYDGSGTDRRYDSGGDFLADGGRYAESTDSRKYSIRALFLS